MVFRMPSLGSARLGSCEGARISCATVAIAFTCVDVAAR